MSLAAAIQMCSTNSLDDNLNTADRLISEAAGNHARLVVLPEMFAYIDGDEPLSIIEPIGQGRIQSFLSDQARKHALWLVGGTTPIKTSITGKARSSCLIYDDKGTLRGRYDKIHLFDVTLSTNELYKESDTIEAGDSLTIINTPLGRLGVGICYDLRFPELFRCLLQKGVDLIAIPAAFTVTTGKAHWEILTRSRAIDNFAYIIGAAQGGTHSRGRQTYGHSLIVDPWGTVIAEQPNQMPGIIYGEIDLKKQHDIRQAIPIEQHQRILCDLSGLNKPSFQ